MKELPPVPRVANAPSDLFDGGHLWIQEKVDGAHLRFRLRESGLLLFGDEGRVYDPSEMPAPYSHAVRHVRERLDRDALRAAVDDVEEVVFFGAAMHRRTVGYDWDRTPSFLGFDVWSGTRERFLPPDAVERIYERLGLDPVNAFDQEVRASGFDPDSFEVPASNWYDGPAAGVVVRDKTGLRAAIPHPDVRASDGTGATGSNASVVSGEELARRYATERRFEAIADELRSRDRPDGFDAIYQRLFDRVAREEHERLYAEASGVDLQEFRSELAALTRQFLGDGT